MEGARWRVIDGYDGLSQAGSLSNYSILQYARDGQCVYSSFFPTGALYPHRAFDVSEKAHTNTYLRSNLINSYVKNETQ